MTRFRTSGWETDRSVTTHCTIDAGDGEPQTAITFRSKDGFTDVLVVSRPFPKSGDSSFDSSYSSVWRDSGP